MYYLYILKCADETLYTGITVDLARRIHEHNASKLAARYTRARRPVELIFEARFKDRSSATKEESRIKKMTRTQKLSMIQALKIKGQG